MKKLTFSINAVFMSVFLLSTLSMHGMKRSREQIALQAEEYNDSECPFTSLPNEKLLEIFSCYLSVNEKLENRIKKLLKLSATCKKFNELLTIEEIGKYCKDYDLIDKNEAFKEFITINQDTRKLTLLPILVHAGADVNTTRYEHYALEIAIEWNREELAAILLKHGANPNVIDKYFNPILFRAKTIKMAQMLINNGADLNATNNYKENVLYPILYCSKELELMKLYLRHNVDATQLNYKNDCVLHKLGWMTFKGYPQDRNVENILEKGKFLLTVIPHMINALNNDGKTPLDVAQYEFDEEIKTINKSCYTKKNKPEHKEVASKDFEKIVELFRAHGGLTAQELAQKEKQSQLEHK